MVNYRTQAATLIEVSLYCHSSFIITTRLTSAVCNTLLPSMCIKEHNTLYASEISFLFPKETMSLIQTDDKGNFRNNVLPHRNAEAYQEFLIISL